MPARDPYQISREPKAPGKVQEVGQTNDPRLNIKTTDGNLVVVRSAFFIYQDGAMSLTEFLTHLRDEMEAIPSFENWYVEARSEGWQHDAIMLVLSKGLEPVYGKDFADEKLKYLEDNKESLEADAQSLIQELDKLRAQALEERLQETAIV